VDVIRYVDNELREGVLPNGERSWAGGDKRDRAIGIGLGGEGAWSLWSPTKAASELWWFATASMFIVTPKLSDAVELKRRPSLRG
jgi:hypothetical protein